MQVALRVLMLGSFSLHFHCSEVNNHRGYWNNDDSTVIPWSLV